MLHTFFKGFHETTQLLHFRRATSYYCYPRNYWWFYRPYTTADQGYQRCMPYFHYSGPAMRGRADRVMK